MFKKKKNPEHDAFDPADQQSAVGAEDPAASSSGEDEIAAYEHQAYDAPAAPKKKGTSKILFVVVFLLLVTASGAGVFYWLFMAGQKPVKSNISAAGLSGIGQVPAPSADSSQGSQPPADSGAPSVAVAAPVPAPEPVQAAPAPVAPAVQTKAPNAPAAQPIAPPVAAKQEEPKQLAWSGASLDIKNENPFKTDFLNKLKAEEQKTSGGKGKGSSGPKQDDAIAAAVAELGKQLGIQKGMPLIQPVKTAPPVQVYGIMTIDGTRYAFTSMGRLTERDDIGGVKIQAIRENGIQLETGFVPLAEPSSGSQTGSGANGRSF